MFKEKVLQLYGYKCPITKFFHSECDVAHIIPQALNREYKHNVYNCILLSVSLHRLFDNFMWTFDVFSASKINDKQMEVKLIVSPNLKLESSIMKYYHKNGIHIPISCLPYIYAHYRVFFIKNHTTHKHTNKVLFDEYSTDKNSIEFRRAMMKFPKFNNLPARKYVAIISEQNDKYKVVWEYYSYDRAQWVDKTVLKKEDIEMFHDMKEKKQDPTFTN